MKPLVLGLALACLVLVPSGCGDGDSSGAPTARDDGVLVLPSQSGNSAVPETGNPRGDSGTVTLDLTPNWDTGDPGNFNVLDIRTPTVWENHLKIFKNGDYLRFSVWPSSGVETGAATDISDWRPNQQHHLAVTWGLDSDSGMNEARLFVDGLLISHQAYDGTLELPPGTPLHIGAEEYPGETALLASISDVRIFGHALTSDEIAHRARGSGPGSP